MQDYTKEVTYKSLNNFVDYASKQGYGIEVIEGALNDTYIIYNVDKKLSIKGVKARDFIILYPKFESAWHNSFHLLMTNDEKKVDMFLTAENFAKEN